jgi:ribosome recycling factor
MAYNFNQFDARTREIEDWLSKEFGGIRTGRATPMLLDLVLVDSYGTKVPLNQVGNVNVEDPRTLRVTVWDKNSIKAVEKAIIDANLGVSVIVDGAGLRIIFPELTSERRTQLLKLAKAKLEEARVSVRAARDGTVKELEAAEKEGKLSEDERFAAKELLQKRVDTVNESLDSTYKLKETEINS